ncbi:MAG: DUF4199 family protein [Bacteroidetes bacterium]|jgi:hypothetical protein|nr:DUF4199 family protein [Bacteroidota bacterium]
MKKVVLTFGLIAGLIVAISMSAGLLFMAKYDMSFSTGEIIGYLGMIVAFATIFVAVTKYKNQYNNGVITFGKAFMTGLYVTLVASVLYVLAWMIIPETQMAGDFTEEYLAYSIEEIQDSDLTQEEKQQKIANIETMMKRYEQPLFKIFVTFLEIFPVGLIISLVAAIILRTKASGKKE